MNAPLAVTAEIAGGAFIRISSPTPAYVSCSRSASRATLGRGGVHMVGASAAKLFAWDRGTCRLVAVALSIEGIAVLASLIWP